MKLVSRLPHKAPLTERTSARAFELAVPLRRPTAKVPPPARPKLSNAKSVKFIMVLRGPAFDELKGLADSMGISIQELFRAVIVPEWKAYRNGRNER